MPLDHADVRAWRRQSTGAEPALAPTLIRVDGEAVRTWTGPLMSLALARRLGPKATVRVLQALGRLRQEADTGTVESTGTAMGRKRFLQLGGGLAVAIGLTVTGTTPAFAKSPRGAAASWVEANAGRLPRTYEEIVRHTVPYRKAILNALSPEERAAAWLCHFTRYRAARPDLSADQLRIVDEASRLVDRVFVSRQDHKPAVRRLGERARQTLGVAEAEALLGRLGPADAEGIAVRDCNCATESSYCAPTAYCKRGNCNLIPSDCGDLWLFDCNGRCAPM
ncbi:bacteriocin fulvocin C-related protein [Streptomyces alboflavus]|uniref:bacteriocin fulvocin C-related protein n=1 Tax=Streptomyces alboflavus TaxID=67267 RepID=UPI0012FEF6FB|nr:bacteriocin fulvocin C-related protein [Streptomyces alboflavus]